MQLILECFHIVRWILMMDTAPPGGTRSQGCTMFTELYTILFQGCQPFTQHQY